MHEEAMNMFEILKSIKDSKRSTSLGNYIDFSSLCFKMYGKLEPEAYKQWQSKTGEQINWIINHGLITVNDEMMTKTNDQSHLFHRHLLHQIITPMHTSTGMSSSALLSPLFFRNKDSALKLLDYLRELSAHIITTKAGQRGYENSVIVLQETQLAFNIDSKELYKVTLELLEEYNVLTKYESSTPAYFDSYRLTKEGYNFIVTINNYFNLTVLESNTMPRNVTNMHIAHVAGNVNNADTIDASTTTTTTNTTTINNSFEQIINNATTLNPEEKEKLISLHRENPKIGERLWALLNSVVNGAATGAATVAAAVALGG